MHLTGFLSGLMAVNHPLNAPKKLINNVETVVPDFIDGLLLTDSRLRRIGSLQAVAIASHLTSTYTNVRIISGGGSGHEPAHAGFIGEGMLSAAALGNVFASPSVATILAALRVCANPKGILLVVKNYTGDRINFGMAVERARGEGISVRMLIVDDDCALAKEKGITGGRGIAGTVLIHKIVGAAAAKGLSLEEVYSVGAEAVRRLRSMGVALSTCTLPGSARSSRLDGPLMEVGLGIHGEQGREQVEFPETGGARLVASILVSAVAESIMPTDEPVALLLNNLGSTPAIELMIVAKEVLAELSKRDVETVRIFIGPFMTALDMSGVSLSLLPVNAELLALLDAPTSAPHWHPSLLDKSTVSTYQIPYVDRAVLVRGGRQSNTAYEVVRAVCERLVAMEPILTEMDQVCGDGDCGLVLKAGASRILADLASMKETTSDKSVIVDDSATFCSLLADSISSSMGGTSGGLLELMCRAMATHHAALVLPLYFWYAPLIIRF